MLGIFKMAAAALRRLIDHSTPVQVVNAAYDTSGNGGRKLVRLSNGWLVAAAFYSPSILYFYVSKDNGETFSDLCNINFGFSAGWAIVNDGNIVKCFYGTASANLRFNSFDATTQTNIDIYTSSVVVESGQTSGSAGLSLAIDSSGNLYAAWCSKNATYPNSFNIRHAKSVNGGTTWTKADGTAGVDQITTQNVAGQDNTNPCVVINSSGNPTIIWQQVIGTTQAISCKVFVSGAWDGGHTIYSVVTYVQSNPCAVVAPNGRIWVTWHGKDSTPNYDNIRVSYSDDNGATWSAMTKLTSNNTTQYQMPSICVNKLSEVFIWFHIPATLEVRQLKYSGTWGADTLLFDLKQSPSCCNNYDDFEAPLTIMEEWQTTPSVAKIAVEFYGKWNE